MIEQVPKPVLTQEQEPRTRVDAEQAYWMGHAMVANMDRALQLRHEAANPLEGTALNSRGQTFFAVNPAVDTANAIQYERAADLNAIEAGQAYKNADFGKLDELTKEGSLPSASTYVQPNNLYKFESQLENDAKKQAELKALHETLFEQEGRKILFDSRNVKTEANKLAEVFAGKAGTGDAKVLEQGAKAAIGNFNLALREYFNPNRITELQKRDQLRFAPREINDALSSIAYSAGLGEAKNGRFTPEKLDLFNDPEGVTHALEYAARNAKGPQALAIAQKSMRLLSRMQGYETIMSPTGMSVQPLENGLRRISAMVGAKNEARKPQPAITEPERDREDNRRAVLEEQERKPLTPEQLQEFGHSALPEQEFYYDRSRER